MADNVVKKIKAKASYLSKETFSLSFFPSFDTYFSFAWITSFFVA